MWAKAAFLIVAGCVGGVSAQVAAPKPNIKPPQADSAAQAAIKRRPGTVQERALLLSVLQQGWYRFANEKGPGSDYYRQTATDRNVRAQLEWSKKRIAESADVRRSAFEFNATWVDQGNALLDPDRDPRHEVKYLLDWATADSRNREVPITEQECVNRDYGRTWLCLQWKNRRRGAMHVSRDGQLISITFPGEDYISSFVPTSLLR